MTHQELVTELVRRTRLKSIDVRCVLNALSDTVAHELRQGRSVSIENLGALRHSISLAPKKEKRHPIHFTPSATLKKKLAARSPTPPKQTCKKTKPVPIPFLPKRIAAQLRERSAKLTAGSKPTLAPEAPNFRHIIVPASKWASSESTRKRLSQLTVPQELAGLTWLPGLTSLQQQSRQTEQ